MFFVSLILEGLVVVDGRVIIIIIGRKKEFNLENEKELSISMNRAI